jgi:CBS domain-containing membrane protein
MIASIAELRLARSPCSRGPATVDDSRHSRRLNRHAFHRDGDRNTDVPISTQADNQ